MDITYQPNLVKKLNGDGGDNRKTLYRKLDYWSIKVSKDISNIPFVLESHKENLVEGIQLVQGGDIANVAM